MRGNTPLAGGIVVGLISLLGACGPGGDQTGGGTEGRDSAAAVDSSTSAAVPAVEPGSILGTVRVTGDLPPAREVAISEDTAACGVTLRIEPVESGPGGTLIDAVVTLSGVDRAAPPDPGPPPELDQQNCRFRPHVVAARTGQTVRILNNDPVAHNVHTAAFDNRAVNRTQPAGAGAIELSFDAPEKVRVKCDLHPWMSAWIVVVDHPHHAVTGPSGRFELPGVPPGTYELEVWHETLGTSRRTVTVTPGETVELDLEVPAEG